MIGFSINLSMSLQSASMIFLCSKSFTLNKAILCLLLYTSRLVGIPMNSTSSVDLYAPLEEILNMTGGVYLLSTCHFKV